MIRRTWAASGLALLLPLSALAGLAAPADGAPRRDRYGDPLPAGVVLRLGTARPRVECGADSLAFSPDGKFLAASGDCCGLVHVWEASTGKPVLRLDVAGRLHGVAFSPDGRRLAVRNTDGDGGVWEVPSGRRLVAFTKSTSGGGGPAFLAFTPDGKSLLFSRGDLSTDPAWEVVLADAASGAERRSLTGPVKGSLLAAAFSQDGTLLALSVDSAGKDGRHVRLLDVATGKLHREVREEGAPAEAVVFSPAGRTLAVGGEDEIVLYRVATGERVGRLAAEMGTVSFLAFADGGRTLVSHSDDGKARAWDIARGRPVREIEKAGVLAALSPDGRTLAVSDLSAVRLWDLATGKELLTSAWGHVHPVCGVAYTPDGRTLASSDGTEVRLWDPATGACRRSLPAEGEGLAFAPDGRRLVTSPSVWDVEAGKEVLSLLDRPPENWDSVWQTATFFPDGRSLLSAGLWRACDADNRRWVYQVAIRRRDAGTGRLLDAVTRNSPESYCLAISPDGRSVAASGERGALRLLDAGTGKSRWVVSKSAPASATSLAFSPDGSLLAGGSSGGWVTAWEAATGRPVLRRAVFLRYADAVAFSPDGRLLAVAESGDSRQTPPHFSRRWGWSLEALRGGYFAVPASKELEAIRVWDMGTGREVKRVEGLGSPAQVLAFAPDGRHLATGMEDGTLLVCAVELPHARRKGGEGPTAAVLEGWWADLAGDSAPRAYRTMAELASWPGPAVALLSRRLDPAAAPDLATLRRLLRELDDDDFAVREAATARLRRLRDQEEPALRQALAAGPGAEVRRRLEAILAEPPAPPKPDELRARRAIQALEWVGTAEARRVLEVLAGGYPDAPRTLAARAALARLALTHPGQR
jgi:WD40 repeat protein